MRGKLACTGAVVRVARIIPASAGQTTAERLAELERTDHPRECGANHVHGAYGEVDDGSSPRVRGKLRHLPQQRVRLRIIPASAGQTAGVSDSRQNSADHPRECGANSDRCPSWRCTAGSSPRVRGKLARSPLIHLRQRIIPASAGQTPSVALIITASADHPRECGANSSLVTRVVVCTGSSPRVRGKQGFVDGHLVELRIIPASAGQTSAN